MILRQQRVWDVQSDFLGGYDIGLPQEFSSQADLLNDLLRQRQFQSSPNLQHAPKFGAEESPDILHQGTGSSSHNAMAYPLDTTAIVLRSKKHPGSHDRRLRMTDNVPSDFRLHGRPSTTTKAAHRFL